MPGDPARLPRPASELAERLGVVFRDPSLLARALVHGSWLHEHPEDPTGHNERLEFLGDAVVSLVISEELHARRPGDDEGVLSARRAAIVSRHGLARLARRLDLGEYLLLGEGEEARGGRHRPGLLASALEAVAAAIFLDRGWDAARAWLAGLAAPELAVEGAPGTFKSPKSRLQELTQRRSGERPAYRLVEVTGPDHQRRFVVDVAIGGRVVGTGSGASRRSAETAAAAAALADVAVAPPGGDERGVAAAEDGAGAAAAEDGAAAGRPIDG
ncbi:MAG: ribonuclease III [Chloroflexi bacterium]|nr:ribonuclease III [Chloroflexota bacterium]